MSILIVDDESESRRLLTDILRSEGIVVRAADRGELALASLAMEKPMLILLDIRMPGMDGFEVCHRLKQSEDTRDIPVILLSASGEFSDRIKGLRLGAVDFINKPFQREELLTRVRTHLEFSRLRAHLEERVAERTAQLRESEERFRAIADAAPVMIWISDVDKSCTFFNRRWLEFTGRSMSEELGNGWADGVHSDDFDRCLTTYTSSFDARMSFEMEYRLRRSDGEYRWVLDRGVPSFSPDGVFSGYIGSCIDITDRRQDQDRMLASQKLESLGVMAAGVAHDFGNLLGTILADADLALSEMDPDSAGRDSVQKIAAVAMRASEIVRLLMASAGAKGSSDALGPLDLSLEVEQILRLLNVSISKRAAVRTNLAGNLPEVRGNAAQIHQVVMNLITNASEALGGKQGTITVSTDFVHVAGGRSNDLLSLAEGDYVRLRVSDTGCGMTDETRARIFDQFFTTKSTGRGLGLAAVHGIVRSHGGAIRVESAPGAGSTFEVLFPSMPASRTLAAGAGWAGGEWAM
jgi:two-component system cell cycle sensor histidine kinase/response regulator CckA